MHCRRQQMNSSTSFGSLLELTTPRTHQSYMYTQGHLIMM
jgi:hypothetical protein